MHSTAQHSTAQHSTAQHSTAQHSTAQHSTAQHSTAQPHDRPTGSAGSASGLRAAFVVAILVTLAALAIGSVERTAVADECWDECVKVYRAIDLGPIGSPSALGIPFASDLTYAINRHGDRVWFVQDFGAASGVPIRSFVQVATTKFGLTRLASYELLPPASLPNRTVVVATDINDDGWIVGYVGNVENIFDIEQLHADFDARAVIWRLDQASGSPPVIPAFNAHPAQVLTSSGPQATACASFLHAVNNDSPPMVAGRVTWDYCPFTCLPDFFASWTVGFSRCASLTTVAFGHFGTGGSGGTPGQPTADGAWSTVLDVSTSDPIVAPFPLAVGYDGWDTSGCQGPAPIGCENFDDPRDGLAWSNGSSTPILLPELGAPNDRGRTQARGVVAGGHIVGGSALPFGIFCRLQSTYWPSAGSASMNLWDVCGGGDEINQAEAIVAPEDVIPQSSLAVVGGTSQAGFVWLNRTVGGWCCNRLNDITVNAIPSVPGMPLDVRFGHDLAPMGQIIGDGRAFQQIGDQPQAVNHAMVLTCVFDLDGDLKVNGADLGILLEAYGSENAVLDLTCDGVVDSADLGALLNAWADDGCVVGKHVILCGCELAAEATATVATSFEDAVTLAGFGNVESFVEWGLAAPLTELESAALFIKAIMVAVEPPIE